MDMVRAPAIRLRNSNMVTRWTSPQRRNMVSKTAVGRMARTMVGSTRRTPIGSSLFRRKVGMNPSPLADTANQSSQCRLLIRDIPQPPSTIRMGAAKMAITTRKRRASSLTTPHRSQA